MPPRTTSPEQLSVGDTSRPTPEYGDGPNYVRAVRHHWLAIFALVAVAVSAAVLYSHHSGRHYDAEAVLLVTPRSSSDDALSSTRAFQETGNAGTSVYALGRLISTPAVVDRVRQRLGEPNATRQEILDTVAIKPAQQSSTVSIVATSSSAQRSAKIANAFADVVLARRAREVQRDIQSEIARLRGRLTGAAPSEALVIQGRLAELYAFVGTGDPTVRSLVRAVPPDKPSSAPLIVSIVVAVLSASIVGVALAFLLEILIPRVQSDDEVLSRLPILARVPRVKRRVIRSYLNGNATLPNDVWEAYRILRASLSSRSSRSVLVTSAIQGEGKTMTSVNLAIALAAAGEHVVLIDADLRRPMIARVFGISGAPAGFADLLFGRAEPSEVFVQAPGYGDRLRLVLPGSGRPLDLFEPRRISAMLERLKGTADVVILDSPALTEFADALALADAVDTVLVAIRLGRSRRDRFAELMRRLQQQGIVPAGFVITGEYRARGAPRQARLEDRVEPEPPIAVGERAPAAESGWG
jgi:polysaccharide biosynthesis transport protein